MTSLTISKLLLGCLVSLNGISLTFGFTLKNNFLQKRAAHEDECHLPPLDFSLIMDSSSSI
eukprot:Pgem_evm1s16578